MKIGERTIKRAVAQIEDLMNLHLRDINEAYLACDDKVTVDLKVKLGPADIGITVASEISFVKEKVKDKSTILRVDENQATLSFVGQAND